MTIQEEARRVMEQPLILGRLFEKPKCKPWDIVKGRRFECCHGLGEHTRWCFEGMRGKILLLPKFGKISAVGLTQ